MLTHTKKSTVKGDSHSCVVSTYDNLTDFLHQSLFIVYFRRGTHKASTRFNDLNQSDIMTESIEIKATVS